MASEFKEAERIAGVKRMVSFRDDDGGWRGAKRVRPTMRLRKQEALTISSIAGSLLSETSLGFVVAGTYVGRDCVLLVMQYVCMDAARVMATVQAWPLPQQLQACPCTVRCPPVLGQSATTEEFCGHPTR